MFKGKGNERSASGRAQTAGRAELQRQVEGRLGFWRLFLEAKGQELEERRNPAGLQDTPGTASARAVPAQRAGAARRRGTPRRPVQEPPSEHTPSVEPDPRTDDGMPLVDGEAA